MIRRYKHCLLGSFLFLFLFFARATLAFCPVCTIAVAGGVGLSRWLGVDDTITGLWIGAFTISLIVWTLDWFEKRNINFPAKKIITILAYYFFVAAPLYWSDIIGHPLNKIWGIDKLMLGIILGSIFFFAGGSLHFYLKKKNDEKVYFPFQKVAFAISPLIILSAIFYFITK